jgi:ubiquinone/menaquinone biosynthesis C-methylase UbiE
MEDTFTKYQTRGAYHWSATYDKPWRYSPRKHARYDVPLKLLRQHHSFGGKNLGLDLGCGDGVMLYKAMLAGMQIVGIDLSYNGLVLAHEQIEARMKYNPHLVNASCYCLPFPDHIFDYVLSIEAIEHLSEPEQYLSEIKRILRPAGMVALTTPHRKESGILRDPSHIREYTGPELVALLKAYFSNVVIWGMYPAVLDRIYFRATRIHLLDKMARGAFNMLGKWFFNPYMYAITPSPQQGWANLVALCVAKS